MSVPGYESGYDPGIPLHCQIEKILVEEVEHRQEVAGKLVALSDKDPQVFIELCRTEGYAPDTLLPVLLAELQS